MIYPGRIRKKSSKKHKKKANPGPSWCFSRWLLLDHLLLFVFVAGTFLKISVYIPHPSLKKNTLLHFIFRCFQRVSWISLNIMIHETANHHVGKDLRCMWHPQILLAMTFLKHKTSWWFQPPWKILVKLRIFPNFWGENKKSLKPPPGNVCVSSTVNSSPSGWCDPPSPCCSFARQGKIVIHCHLWDICA